MSENDRYLGLIRAIVDNQEKMEGKKVAIGKARSAPLQINADGEIEKYYGEGENALDMLIQQYEQVWGEKVADRKIRNTIRKELEDEEYEKVPERVRPSEDQSDEKGIFSKVKELIS